MTTLSAAYVQAIETATPPEVSGTEQLLTLTAMLAVYLVESICREHRGQVLEAIIGDLIDMVSQLEARGQ